MPPASRDVTASPPGSRARGCSAGRPAPTPGIPCLGYSNGNGTNIGTPWGIYGPNNYQNGGLLPGQTFNRGFN